MNIDHLAPAFAGMTDAWYACQTVRVSKHCRVGTAIFAGNSARSNHRIAIQ